MRFQGVFLFSHQYRILLLLLLVVQTGQYLNSFTITRIQRMNIAGCGRYAAVSQYFLDFYQRYIFARQNGCEQMPDTMKSKLFDSCFYA